MDESPAISVRVQDVPSVRSYSCQAMACAFNFHLIGKDPGLMDSAAMEAEDRLAQLEAQLSFYIESSDTTRINRASTGETIRVSQDIVDCLLLAFDASNRLGGKFNPFLGGAAMEQKGQQNELLHLKGLESESARSTHPVISLDEETNTVTKLQAGPLLDLGGIGKGFALDQLRSLFIHWEIGSGLLECGGSTFLAMQTPSGEKAWELSIGYDDYLESINLANGEALASSGEAFQGSHVIDPDSDAAAFKWKRSYAHAPTAAFADAASTAALLLDSESLESIVRQENALSIALYSDTSAFRCGRYFAV